jgi:hypothetical protein
MFRQTLASLQARVTVLKATGALLTALVALLAASTASAQDLDVSSIAKDDVKKEASGSGSWLPSWGSSSSSAPAVASRSPSVAWYDPLGVFTGASEPASNKTVRRQGLGVTATYNGSSLDTAARVKTTGGVWWDPLEIFYQTEETVTYDDVNGFLAQPRMTD